ncbi:MAG: alpha/beta fold hydrolase [Bacteroidaceae bacterium]
MELPLVIGTDAIQLPGLLTLPRSTQKVPCVILVHGSGPQDRDETCYANKPFRDLAHGLAKEGIATIRYDKRTYVYPTLNREDITIKEEVIDDALAAIRIASSHAEIDTLQLFVAGHSLGGMLVPKIATQSKTLKGVILLAANISPLEDLIEQQMHYLQQLSGEESNASSQQLLQQLNNSRHIGTSSFDSSMPAPFGVPYSYWKDLHAYHPGQVAKSLTIPLLFLNGERDYQVPIAEQEKWKRALVSKPNCTYVKFRLLNHLFMPSTLPPSPKEYSKPSKVATGVIKTISTWIKQLN